MLEGYILNIDTATGAAAKGYCNSLSIGVERFEANVQPHVHFICGCCGAVLDLPQMETPESLRDRVASLSGGRVDSCQLSFTGICQDCLDKNATA